MTTPLLYKVYQTLRRGWKHMSSEAQQALQAFVASQKTDEGYMNAGGAPDTYYLQFGEVLEAVFSPHKLLTHPVRLTVQESQHTDSIYGHFFDFLQREISPIHRLSTGYAVPQVPNPHPITNAICCILSMQHQTGQQPDPSLIVWLQQHQDTTGGFYASDQAPIPDLLSTAVALFTLRLVSAQVRDATDFIQAHWLGNGGFAPTLYDDYSDVEYVFYGLLAIGANFTKG